MTDALVVRDTGSVATPSSRLLRRCEAAAYTTRTHGIPCSPKTLAKYATVGGGPAYVKAGRIPLYSREDLDAWAEARLSPKVRSTSEYRKVREAA